MAKKTNSLQNSVHAEFSWSDDFHFSPPGNGGNSAANRSLSTAVPHSDDFKSVVEKLLETLISTVNADSGIARILPAHGQTHQFFSSVGLPAELLKLGSDLELNCETSCKASMSRGIYSTDLSSCKKRPVCLNAGCRIQSLITAPIGNPASSGRPVGRITLFFSEPQGSFEHVSKSVQSFADLLCALVEQNQTTRETGRSELIAERQAIANEIHDSLAQSLVYTRMRTSMLLESIRSLNANMVAKYAHEIDEALESSQKTVRELITDFRCAVDPAGLLHALRTIVEEFRQRHDIELEYINLVAKLDLPLEYEIQVSHIVQEALANIATHSGATHSRLVVDLSDGYYVFTIDDNGSGGCTFLPVEGHYGMKIMRERAHRIGGEILVESSQGVGTRIRLYFPEPSSDWREVNE
jgi:two-component system nitrate/nitrite sensor histidine kinase NarX